MKTSKQESVPMTLEHFGNPIHRDLLEKGKEEIIGLVNDLEQREISINHGISTEEEKAEEAFRILLRKGDGVKTNYSEDVVAVMLLP